MAVGSVVLPSVVLVVVPVQAQNTGQSWAVLHLPILLCTPRDQKTGATTELLKASSAHACEQGSCRSYSAPSSSLRTTGS